VGEVNPHELGQLVIDRTRRVRRNALEPTQLELLDLATEIARGGITFLRVVPKAAMARVITFHPHGQGSGREQATSCPDRNQRSAKCRATRTMLEIARAERLDSLLTLTFAQATDLAGAQQAWRSVIRRVSPQQARPYIVVPEYGRKDDSIHLHVLLRQSSGIAITQAWQYGSTDTKQIPTSDLKNVTAYLAKNFASPTRPKGNRYWASRGIKPAARTCRITQLQSLSEELSEFLIGDIENLDIVKMNLGTITTIEWEQTDGRQ